MNPWGTFILKHLEITSTRRSRTVCPEGFTGRVVHQSAFITQSADRDLVDTGISNNGHGAETRTLNVTLLLRTLIFQRHGEPLSSTKARQVNLSRSRDAKPKFSPACNSESAGLTSRRQRPPYVRRETPWVSKKGVEPSALPPGPGTMLPLILSKHASHSS